MKIFAKLNILVFICAFSFGCAHQQKAASLHGELDDVIEQSEIASANSGKQARYRRLLPTKAEQKNNAQLMRTAHSALGTPYVRGGDDPSGFDCSGFVQWTYKSVGVKLPRTAREQSVVGQRINRVEDMVAGDIVTFRHPKRGYHTGIYVGDGKFIHSPRKRTRVRINALDDAYFSSTFTGARRVSLNGGENLIAQAESRLAEERVSYAYNKKGNTKNKKQLQKGKSPNRMIASVTKSKTNKNEKTKVSKSGKKHKRSDIAQYQSRGKNGGKHNVERSKRNSKSKTSASNTSRKTSSRG